MKGRMIAIGVGMLLGSVLTLAAVLWLHAGLQHAAAQGGGAAAPSGNGDVNGDGKIDISDGVYVLSWLFTGGPAPKPIQCTPGAAGMLPATGQTTCYNRAGAVIACESADFPGQDGFYQAGCPNDGERYVDNGDGTVTDHCTGLMWQKETAPGSYNWQDALKYCEGLELGGYPDWRLPTVRDLQCIVDLGRVGPAIDPVLGGQSVSYWSSTTAADLPSYAWFVDFLVGIGLGDGKSNLKYVRAVRTAQ
jgi:hypothetical protein